MTLSIDLNADLGEDESADGISRDLAMMEYISSCNIACGGHAGSSDNMRRMLVAAKNKGVSAGAHPSYPDRENFGRRTMIISSEELAIALTEQLTVIRDMAADTGSSLSHIKPHGALYNDAQDNEPLADVLISIAMREQLRLVGMAGSVLQSKAKEAGLPYVTEAFIDRRYTDSARLVPRDQRDAVIKRDDERIKQGLALAKGRAIESDTGRKIHVAAQTLCLHSDSQGAIETARKMKAALEQADISITSAQV